MDPTIVGALIAAGGVALTAIGTVSVATRDLRLRRQLESTKSFLDVMAHANGRPRDGRDGVGVAEQVAAVRIVGDLGRKNTSLRRASLNGLVALSGWGGSYQSDQVAIAASHELTLFSKSNRASIGTKAAPERPSSTQVTPPAAG